MRSIKTEAYGCLARRSYFSKELAVKLQEKGFGEKEISTLIEELIQKGVLNDEDLASRFVERETQRGYGLKRVAMKLKQKGGVLPPSLQDSKEVAIALVQKRYLKDLALKRPKVIAALLRRGFSYDLITQVLHSIKKEEE